MFKINTFYSVPHFFYFALCFHLQSSEKKSYLINTYENWIYETISLINENEHSIDFQCFYTFLKCL